MSSPERMDGGSVAQERAAFAARLLRSLSGLFDVATIVTGDQLGLYRQPVPPTLSTEALTER